MNKPITIPQCVVEALPGISGAELRVILVLCSAPSKHGEVTITTSQIASRTGLMRRTIFSVLAELEERNWINRTRDTPGPFAATLRLLFLDSDSDQGDVLKDGDDDLPFLPEEPDFHEVASPAPVIEPPVPVLVEGDDIPEPAALVSSTSVAELCTGHANPVPEEPEPIPNEPEVEPIREEPEPLVNQLDRAVETAYRKVSSQELRQLQRIGDDLDLLESLHLLTLQGGVDPTCPLDFLESAIIDRVRQGVW